LLKRTRQYLNRAGTNLTTKAAGKLHQVWGNEGKWGAPKKGKKTENGFSPQTPTTPKCALNIVKKKKELGTVSKE